MNESPLVSVVIPCFNGEDLVADAIESALQQTWANIEVVVVDDGSTDESWSVISRFEAEIVARTGDNRGGCAARNSGLEMASGDYIQFLDADDYLHAEKIATQMREFESGIADVVLCKGEVTPASDSLAAIYARELFGSALEFFLSEAHPILSPLHKRSELLRIGGFRETLPCSQERDLHLRLAASGSAFSQVPDSLFTVRRTAGSVSSDSVKVLLQHLNIAQAVLEVLRENDGLTQKKKDLLSIWLAKDARILLRSGRRNEAMEFIEMSDSLGKSASRRAAYSPASRLFREIAGAPATEAVGKLIGGCRKMVNL